MGNYNFFPPQILGEEWVPIRDEDLFLTPVVNTLETGHGFTLATTRTLSTGRFYLNQFPNSDAIGQVFQVSVYPRGTEALSGPIRSVVIPVNNGGVTGSASFSGASSLSDALADPSDGRNLTISGGTPADGNADLYFATNQYSQILQGKRIVAVNLLYTATSSTLDDFDGRASIMPPAVTDGILYASTGGGSIVAPEAGPGRPEISRITFGEVSPFFSNTPSATVERQPWIYADLQRFEISHANRITVRLAGFGNPSGTAIFYLYAALEVIYCDEQRLAVSGVAFGPPTTNSFFGTRQRYVYGANVMTMRTMNNLALNPVLAPGAYSLMLSSPETGIAGVQSTPYPVLNALRQLYEIPPHPAIQVNIPKPAEDHIGDTFTSTVSMVLPQISLHASGGTLTEPHAYGRQAAAQVWDANTATQEIYDDISGIAATYPQVRFYARRFGSTSVPLTLTGVGGLSGSTVSITPDDFDALTEIVDGWAEVTLRFGTPPSMGAVAGNPAWTWSATTETAGNRWEVLAACAPAISGVPGNLFNLVPSPNQLGTATYQPPSGDTVELTWMPQGIGSPWVSGASSDSTTDAVLLFSQDPPTVTGVSLSQLTQTVTGIGLNCGSLSCCIPSGIGYQRLTWEAPNTNFDTFNRTAVVNGWGVSTSGDTWLNDAPDADYDTTGTIGTIQPTTLANNYNTWLDTGATDVDVRADFQLNALPASGTFRFGVVGRLVDGDNTYRAEAVVATTGVVTLRLTKMVATVETVIASLVLTNTLLINTWYTIELRVAATTLQARMWKTADPTPAFQIAATDTSLTAGTNAGVFTRNDTAVTTHVLSVDNYVASPPAFGAFELQRFDTVTATFQTIMLATGPTTSSFNDFESRVGLSSVYRIRMLNIYNFAGSWSTQVTGAPPAPGVTGGCADATGALIFTSNADQSGLSNAAYIMQWDGAPDETFTLPEGNSVQFQEMYGRDGRVAFHGTERGLETFSRTLLIHAGAIDPARLADTTTLRDLAWRDLPYVCVRDDIGDRWYANVQLPAVSVMQNRTQYMARVDIVELTRTPAQVNP